MMLFAIAVTAQWSKAACPAAVVINTTRPRKKKQCANLTAFPAPTITESNTTEQ
jgi:hypothetical protein